MSTPLVDRAQGATSGGTVGTVGTVGMGGTVGTGRTVETSSAGAPIEEQVRATFATLDASAVRVAEQATRISDTLEVLDEALSHVAGGNGGHQEGAGFGMVSLPIVAALRAARALAGQYVKQQTGTSLTSWTQFVESSSTMFDDYLVEVAAIRATIEQHRNNQGPLDADRAAVDIGRLTEARWRTEAWKVVLGRVAKLGQVVEAVLATDLGALDGPERDAPPPEPQGLAGTFQRRLKEVQSRTLDRTGDMREWVLRPFVDVRDRVKELPGQVDRLAHEVSLFELLLELEVAALRAALGQVDPDEVKVLGLRVCAGVVIPDLAHRLTATRAEVATHEGWLARLDEVGRSGQVAPEVAAVLRTRYQDGLAGAHARLVDLQERAEPWRRSGPETIRACSAWVQREIDVLTARQAVEGAEVDLSRRALLLRERERLVEATSLIALL